MCGITAVFNKAGISSAYLRNANSIIAHRGPDDEGYLLWKANEPVQVLLGKDTAEATHRAFQYAMLPADRTDWTIGLGHRRLSIIDLSPGGHQPMVLQGHDLVLSFNGEVYNYIEIRKELQGLGHSFHSESDTEVILHAWAEWGSNCLHRFNGMFAFILFDTRRQKLYAVRDRFGVKPLYYTDTSSYLAFASEVKQLRELPSYTFKLQKQIAYDYLRYGLLDHTEETFEEGVRQVMPGHFIELDVATGKWKSNRWYTLQAVEWRGTEKEACDHFFDLLKDSVRLRMRSDVPVGSALSGGLDSSTVVCLMRKVLEEQGKGNHLIKTITACQEDKKYDEWIYAEEVIRTMRAESHKVFPSFEQLEQDLDRLLWHMDYPFGSTSQFSQWCVFEGAKRQGLTVMIDGQGADEQLAGYGGNDLALYAGLLAKGNLHALYGEAKSYHRAKGQWPIGLLIRAAQTNFPALGRLIPKSYALEREAAPNWLKNIYRPTKFTHVNLQQRLRQQVMQMPLPALLRYEDRNSMAFSVESRVPFMDYRLIEFTHGLPEHLVYRQGERKYILRKTFRGLVPDKILDRQDKMGFVSPEERWMKEDGKDWFGRIVESSVTKLPDVLSPDESMRFFRSMQSGEVKFGFEPWRMLCLGQWMKRRKR